MSMSALLSTLRGPGRQQLSASTTALRQTSGSHVLRIEGYTQVSKKVAHGVEMRSSTFAVGGHNWRICCYPNGSWGCGENDDKHISLFISKDSYAVDGRQTLNIRAATVSILDTAGMPSYTQTNIDDKGFGLGWRNFISHKDLDKEKHLKDD